MKRLLLIFLISLLLIVTGCSASDRLTGTTYFDRVDANHITAEQIGSPTDNVTVGYFHEIFVDGGTLYIGGIPFVVSGNLTYVQGPQGEKGDIGLQGIQGIQGEPGPTHSNLTILDNIQEALTTALKTAYDWLVTNITAAWKVTIDNFINSKGQASGLAPLDSNSRVPIINLPTSTQYNQSVTQQAGFAADTYLVGSNITIPTNSLKVGTRYHLIFDVSKTGAGVAAPIIYVRFGTNGSTSDTARLTFTFLAQTAVADIGTFEVWVTFRTVGSGTSAAIQGTGQVRHRLQITGLQNLVSTTLQVTSAGFDSTVANSKIGVSINGGTSAVWTVQLVQAELQNLN